MSRACTAKMVTGISGARGEKRIRSTSGGARSAGPREGPGEEEAKPEEAAVMTAGASDKLLLMRIYSFMYILIIGVLHSLSGRRRRLQDPKVLATAEAVSEPEVPVNNTKLTVSLGVKVLGEVVKGANALTRRQDGTINRQLADLLEFKVAANAQPVNGVSSRDVVIDEATNVWARIFIPEVSPHRNQKLPVMVYYHGGGFGVLCANLLFYDRLCRRLSRTCRMVVVSVNYRRAPEHKFPIAYDDSFKALEWLRSPASASYLPPAADVSHTFLCGDSAGGNIVHFVGCRAVETDLGPVKISGMILLQPYLGSEARVPSEINLVSVPIISIDATDWHWRAFLPEGANRDHPACNVFGPYSRDISVLNLPPMFVAVGNLDVLLDHQLHYVRKIQEMGKSVKMKNYDGGIHGFYMLDKMCIELALACMNDMNEFIQSCLLRHD